MARNGLAALRAPIARRLLCRGRTWCCRRSCPARQDGRLAPPVTQHAWDRPHGGLRVAGGMVPFPCRSRVIVTSAFYAAAWRMMENGASIRRDRRSSSAPSTWSAPASCSPVTETDGHGGRCTRASSATTASSCSMRPICRRQWGRSSAPSTGFRTTPSSGPLRFRRRAPIPRTCSNSVRGIKPIPPFAGDFIRLSRANSPTSSLSTSCRQAIIRLHSPSCPTVSPMRRYEPRVSRKRFGSGSWMSAREIRCRSPGSLPLR